MKKAIYLTLFLMPFALEANIVADVQKIENAFSEPFYLAGSTSQDLTPQMVLRKEALEIRSKYPDAWQMYAAGEVEEFSYFGFKLYDMERGRITLKDFLKELQEYIVKNGK